MTFKEILTLNPFHRYQYVKYYRNCAAGYEDMLDGLYKSFISALNDYTEALKDSNNPLIVKAYGKDRIEENILYTDARVQNFSDFIHEITCSISSFNNKADVLEKSIKKDLAYKGIYNLNDTKLEELLG